MHIIIGLVVVAVIAAGAIFLQQRNVQTISEITETPIIEEGLLPSNIDLEAIEETVADAAAQTNEVTEVAPAVEPATTPPAEPVATNDFDPVDDERTFSAEASYFTPRRTQHDITVTLTLKDRVVVAADVAYDGGSASTPSHTRFDDAYEAEVLGKALNDINLSRTGGASLTADAFNEALADIKAQTS